MFVDVEEKRLGIPPQSWQTHTEQDTILRGRSLPEMTPFLRSGCVRVCV